MLLRARGKAMQAACPKGKGGMAVVMGLEMAQIDVLCKHAAQGETLQLANDNSPGQVVISGSAGAIDRAEQLAKNAGAKRYLKLNVSAPFHSALMQPAAKVMARELAEAPVKAPLVKLVANVTAEAVTDPEKIRDLLVEQVTGRVRWTESVQYLAKQGVTQTVEIGSGKVLTGLSPRIVKEMQATSIQTPQDIENFLKGI
jgi:[acyl-carrier-protein] S-malonyltransferase